MRAKMRLTLPKDGEGATRVYTITTPSLLSAAAGGDVDSGYGTPAANSVDIVNDAGLPGRKGSNGSILNPRSSALRALSGSRQNTTKEALSKTARVADGCEASISTSVTPSDSGEPSSIRPSRVRRVPWTPFGPVHVTR